MPVDESRLRELQSALQAKVASNQEIADSFKIEDGTVIVDQDQKDAFAKNMKDINEIKSLIEDLNSLGAVESWGNAPSAPSVAQEAAAAAAAAVANVFPESKSLGELFLGSDEFKSLAGGRNGVNMNAPWEFTGNTFGAYQKDVYSALPTGTPGSFGRIQRDPIVESAKRKTRVRDLFPARSTTAAVIEYFKVSGFADHADSPYTTVNAASTVAERQGSAFGRKPQTSLAFVGEQAPVRTIAHWEAAHRNVLADEPQLRAIIDNELLYGLRIEEDDQILNGNGSGENLMGILSRTDIQTYSWSAGETLPVPDTRGDAVRRAATLAFLAHYEPTGVVLHPNDWEKIELNKDENGQYLMAVSMQLGAEARLWRMPVVDTPAMPEGTALVGAFGTGAQLYDREGSSIRISENHEDFFVRNAIVVLAEERLALAVKRPESFVEVTFDAAPS